MKKILLSLVAIATIALSSFGQAPEAFKYQAVVRDAGGLILNNQAVGMRLTVQQGSIGGTAVYTETFSPTTNGYGLVNLEIGTGTTTDDFTMIDWSNGPYFMETSVDFLGGMTWVVMGTSQLMSVPYALHSKTAENVTNDLVDDADADPTNELQDWSNLPGIPAELSDGTDDVDDADADPTNELQDISTDNTSGNITLSNGSTLTLNVDDADTDATNELQQLTVSTTGDTLYLQNGGYVIIPGISAANASGGGGGTYPTGSVFCASGATAIVDVTNPTTGAIWMDRNLGATQAATSSTDVDAYGDLYQWGRFSDGHQCRTSATTSTLSSVDQPAHGDFITSSPSDWRSPQNNNLWQGVNGINNPCPSGYRIPTVAELDAERLSWSVSNAAGAIASPLKLPMAGRRAYFSGVLDVVGSNGSYWSSEINGLYGIHLTFDSSGASNNTLAGRAVGGSIRCIKE
ncbi:fibrobacter succinogenes major paralogous domain-containing protein [Flavobacteriales bacterium]|nr:fibrobacter succinogenes major paralogous domain-containing protein [Flavobacteriales bacterium]